MVGGRYRHVSSHCAYIVKLLRDSSLLDMKRELPMSLWSEKGLRWVHMMDVDSQLSANCKGARETI